MSEEARGHGAGRGAEPPADTHWELHEQLADVLSRDPTQSAVVGAELGLDPREVDDVALALAALGAVTAFDEPDPTLTETLEPGEQIGDYEVFERIGRGGFSVVYRARDPVLDVDVALKLLAVPPGVEGEVQDRFAQEARAVARLDHAHVVRVRTAGWDPRGPYLVMDLVKGESLQRRLSRDGPLPVADAVEIARQLAEALDHAHGHGVLHRDVKPDNVLVAEDGVSRLTDFGLARDKLQGDSKVSRAGHALGTPGYWPPEQARGDLEAIGPASDVYGVGATLYALLTGSPPYTGPHTLAILEAMARRAEVPAPSSLRSDVGPGLDALCARCLEHDPARRYPSARALADALATWDPAGDRREEDAGGRRVVVAAVAALVLMFAVAISGLAAGGDEGRSAEGWEEPPPEHVAPVVTELALPNGEPVEPDSPPQQADDPEPLEAAPWWERRPTWQKVAVGQGPRPRADAALASDSARRRVLLFGGAVRKEGNSELWSWTHGEWKREPSQLPMPKARLGAAAVYDTRRELLVVLGGRSGSEWLEDLWEWDGRRWKAGALPEQAKAVQRPLAVYDPRRGVTVALLGREVWEWDGVGWTRKPSPPTQGRALVWLATRQQVQLFGAGGRLWGYDGIAWRGASSPLPRRKMRFMWAIAAGDDAVLALVGPKPPRKQAPNLETWLYRDDDTWRRLAGRGPGMSLMGGMAWVSGRDQALLFGGERKRRSKGQTWLLSPRAP